MKTLYPVLFVVGSLVVFAPRCGLSAEGKTAPAEPETLVATLTTNQVKEFSAYVRSKSLRGQEYLVFGRMLSEKAKELKGFIDVMQREFNLSPDTSYQYEAASKKVYELSTNKLDKAGNRERTVVYACKSDQEAQRVSRLMLARRLTERQIDVLKQLREEKQKETVRTDAKLREVFHLDPKVQYRLDSETGRVFQVPARKSGPKNTAAASAGTKSAKGK